MYKSLLPAIVLILLPVTSNADCIDRGLDGSHKVFNYLYEEMGRPEPTEDNMDKLTRAMFLKDRDSEPKVDNDITVSYSESEGGVNLAVSCMLNDIYTAQNARWEPNNDLILNGERYTP